MQQLKEQRMSPAEKFVLEKIKGAIPSEPDTYGSVNWYKDGGYLHRTLEIVVYILV